MSLSSQKFDLLSYQENLDILRDHYKDNLFDFAKYCLGYDKMTKNTHKDITDCLMRPTRQKLIVVPRDCFKSTLCSVAYPIWRLIQNPNLRILIDSELYTNSARFLREIKGHLMSEKMKILFGDFQGSTWNDGEIVIKQRTVIRKEASITTSGIGAEKTSQHYDLICGDDLNSKSNSRTQEGRAKVIEHYRAYTSLLDPHHGVKVVVATRYAADDLPGHIIFNEMTDNERKDLGGIRF